MVPLLVCCLVGVVHAAGIGQPSTLDMQRCAPAELLQQADQALMHHEFNRAQLLYRCLLTQFLDSELLGRDRWSLLLDFAHCEKEIGHLQEAQDLLKQILLEGSDPLDRIRAQFLLAHVSASLGHPVQAYALLRLVEQLVPHDDWNRDDLALLTHLSLLLDETCGQQLKRAQTAWDDGNIPEARMQYTQLLNAIEGGFYPLSVRLGFAKKMRLDLQLRIGECYYLEGNFAQTITWLEPCSDAKLARLLLMGDAYAALHEYQKAIFCFQQFLAVADPAEADLEIVEWRLGQTWLRMGQFQEARTAWTRCLTRSRSAEMEWLVHLYLARIDAQEGRMCQAQTSAQYLDSVIPTGHPLACQLRALKGHLAFRQGNFLEAIIELEAALGESYKEAYFWYQDDLNTLKMSYLKQAEGQPAELASLLITRAQKLMSRSSLAEGNLSQNCFNLSNSHDLQHYQNHPLLGSN